MIIRVVGIVILTIDSVCSSKSSFYKISREKVKNRHQIVREIGALPASSGNQDSVTQKNESADFF